MRNMDSDLPWWLADLLSQAEKPRPALPPEPAKANLPQPVVADSPAVAAANSSPAAAKPRPAPPPAQSWKQIAQSWEGPPSEYDKAKPVAPRSAVADSLIGWKRAPATKAVRDPELEDFTFGLAARLSGLRSRLSVPGGNGQQQAEEPAAKAPEAVGQIESMIDRPGVALTIMTAPVAETPVTNSAASAPLQMAEFHSPKPVAEEKENSRTSGFNGRRERLDDDDDLLILPCWRGQYKRTSRLLPMG